MTMVVSLADSSARQDIFPHFMGTDIGRVDIAHCVSRNTGCRSARSHHTEVARIRDESEQRAINEIYGLLVIDIADPQIALLVDCEPMRIDEHAGTKALEQLAGWIELQDRWIGLAATETGGNARRHCVEAAQLGPDGGLWARVGMQG
jgi:hypothetical protein